MEFGLDTVSFENKKKKRDALISSRDWIDDLFAKGVDTHVTDRKSNSDRFTRPS